MKTHEERGWIFLASCLFMASRSVASAFSSERTMHKLTKSQSSFWKPCIRANGRVKKAIASTFIGLHFAACCSVHSTVHSTVGSCFICCARVSARQEEEDAKRAKRAKRAKNSVLISAKLDLSPRQQMRQQ